MKALFLRHLLPMSNWEDIKKGIDKYKICMYSWLTNTFIDKDKCVTVDVVPAVTSYISVCISEFYKDVVKSQDTGDLFQKIWQAVNYTCPGGHWYNTNFVSLDTNSCNHNVYILPQHYDDMPKKACHYSGWQTLNKKQLYMTLVYSNYIKHSPFIWLKENGSSKSENAHELN